MDPFLLEMWSPVKGNFGVVAKVLEHCDDGSLSLLSAIDKKIFRASFSDHTPLVGDEVSLLDFTLLWDGTMFWACGKDSSVWFVRAATCLDGVGKIRDLCAGIGALGSGASFAGFQVVSAVEIQPRSCKVFAQNQALPIIEGNICDAGVIGRSWQAAPGPAGIASGFSCQPFSAFGDRRAQEDSRSCTLPGTLRAAQWLQAPFVLLECVCPAGKHPWVRAVLAAFCKATGFVQKEVELELAQVWPCHRHRWRCLLLHPSLGQMSLDPWPAEALFQSVSQLVDSFRTSDADRQQLELTGLELEWLGGLKPLTGYCLRVSNKLPTALHSWGSQIYPCPCECRPAFADERLRKGISGVLVPCPDPPLDRPAWRHLHPKELAVLNGCDPGWDFGPSLRLSLALLGQVASPFTSCLGVVST